MKRELDCIVAGQIVADVLARPINALRPSLHQPHSLLDHVRLSPGGFAANLSLDLRRLGISVGVIARIGRDEWREPVLAPLHAAGADTSRVIVDRTAQTPVTLVCVDSSGERTFYNATGAHRNLGARDILRHRAAIGRARVFAIGYYGFLPGLQSDLPRVLRTLRQQDKNLRILLDTGTSVRPTLPDLARSLPYVDFFIPSEREAAILTRRRDPREQVKVFRDAGAGGLVGIKLGARGCLLADGHQLLRLPAHRVRHVVDTTGAGDAFLAGIITAHLHGMDLETMGRFANAVAACCVQAMGGSAGVRSFQETMRLIR